MGAPRERTSTPGVYKRGDRYVAVYRDPEGRQRQRAARTLAEARKLRAALSADVARGEHRELSRITFAEYAAEWSRTYTGRTGAGIRAETLKDYARDLELHVTPFLARRRLTEIEPRDVKALARHLADSGKAPATVRAIIAPLRALLATAVEEGLIRHNPAAGLRLASAPHKPAEEAVKALTPAELAALVAAAPAEWRLFLRFLAHTGLRISECIALRWSDLDLGTGRVKVTSRIYRAVRGEPKSKYGVRVIPLSADLARELWSARQASRHRADADPIFPSREGTPLRPENVYRRVMKPAARAAGVPWAAFHTLRHTCATFLFRAGATAPQVQRWLGHHSPAFTLATYVHLLPSDLPDPELLAPVIPGSPALGQVREGPPATAVEQG